MQVESAVLYWILACTGPNELVATEGMPFELNEMKSSLFITEFYGSTRDDRAEGFFVLTDFALGCEDILDQRWLWGDEDYWLKGQMVLINVDWYWWPMDWQAETEPPGSLGWKGLYGENVNITEKAGEGMVRRDMRTGLWSDGTGYELDSALGLLDIQGIEGGKVIASLEHDLMRGELAAKNCGVQDGEGTDSGYYY